MILQGYPSSLLIASYQQSSCTDLLHLSSVKGIKKQGNGRLRLLPLAKSENFYRCLPLVMMHLNNPSLLGKGFTPYLYLYNIKYQNASLKKTKAFLILIQKLFQFPGQLLQFLRLSLEQSVSLWTPSSIVLPESKLVGSW